MLHIQYGVLMCTHVNKYICTTSMFTGPCAFSEGDAFIYFIGLRMDFQPLYSPLEIERACVRAYVRMYVRTYASLSLSFFSAPLLLRSGSSTNRYTHSVQQVVSLLDRRKMDRTDRHEQTDKRTIT